MVMEFVYTRCHCSIYLVHQRSGVVVIDRGAKF